MSRESTKHRTVFNVYWYLGPQRSLDAAAAVIAARPRDFGFARAPHARTLARWSAAFDWQERIAAMEAEARRIQTEEQVDEVRKMNERHLKEALALQQKGVARFHNLSERELSPEEARRSIVEGVKLERLIRGESTERTEIKGDARLDQFIQGLSDNELRRLAGLDPEGKAAASNSAP